MMWPAARECLLMKVGGGSRGERKSLSFADAPALGSGLAAQTSAYLRHAVCPRSRYGSASMKRSMFFATASYFSGVRSFDST